MKRLLMLVLVAVSLPATAQDAGTDRPEFVSFTPAERRTAAKRIVRCEASETVLKRRIAEAPSPALLVLGGVVLGVVATGAALYVVDQVKR